MKIGDLARRTGSTTRQLRYYEEQGLLEPDRSGNNYRDYGDEAIEQVRQIKRIRAAGGAACTVLDADEAVWAVREALTGSTLASLYPRTGGEDGGEGPAD